MEILQSEMACKEFVNLTSTRERTIVYIRLIRDFSKVCNLNNKFTTLLISYFNFVPGQKSRL